MGDIHRASSQSWGCDACGRLCQLIMESNNGMAQQVVENRTDLLDLRSMTELDEADDLGLTLPFLAVYYDQPDILKYLHSRGIDLMKPCDPMNFGNPMFYAVSLGRHRLIQILDDLGVVVSKPCDSLNQDPLVHANRMDDESMRQQIRMTNKTRLKKSFDLVEKNLLKILYRRRYLKKKIAITLINKVGRGYLGRVRFRQLAESYVRDEDDDNSDDNARNLEDLDADDEGENLDANDQADENRGADSPDDAEEEDDYN